MIVYDLPGLHNLSVDCGLDSIQWIVSLDCELTNVDDIVIWILESSLHWLARQSHWSG